MKTKITKLLLMAVVTVFSVNVNAQTQKRNVMVGGGLSALDVGLTSKANIKFNLTPKAGFFVKDGLLIGLTTLFGIEHIGKEGNINIIDYGVGAFGRYYITDKNIEIVERGKFFFEANVGVEGRNQLKGGNKTNGLGLGFGPGFAYFLNSNIALETMLKYQGIVGFGDTAYRHDLMWSLGFQIYMPYKSRKAKL
ncbi:MAG: hypothetical protein LBH77_09730 [Tannerella sp.]|nr:hypothetical protein [Tannerella sp.]